MAPRNTRSNATANAATAALADDAPALASLDSFEEMADKDDSHLESAASMTAALDQYLESIAPWVKSYREHADATRIAALAESRVRSLVLLKDGTPDWAGNSWTWKRAVKPRIQATYKSVGMTDGEVTGFELAMRQARFQYGLNALAVAEHKVATTPNLSGEKVIVTKERKDKDGKVTQPEVSTTIGAIVASATQSAQDGSDKRYEIPVKLRQAMGTDYKAQVSGDKKKRLAGFETVPVAFGRKPRQSASTGNRAAAGTPSGNWTALAGQVKKLSPLSFAQQLRLLATAEVDYLHGAPGEAGLGEVKEKTATANEWLELAALCKTNADLLKGESGATKEIVARHRRTKESK